MRFSKGANGFSACSKVGDGDRGTQGGGKGNAQNYFLVAEE